MTKVANGSDRGESCLFTCLFPYFPLHSHLDGVAGSERRVLDNQFCRPMIQPGNRLSNEIVFSGDNKNDRAHPHRSAKGERVGNERQAHHGMKNLGDIRLHAGSLPGGEDDGGDLGHCSGKIT